MDQRMNGWTDCWIISLIDGNFIISNYWTPPTHPTPPQNYFTTGQHLDDKKEKSIILTPYKTKNVFEHIF